MNINTINDAKEALAIYNLSLSKGDYTNEDLSIYKFKGNSVRFTVVNKDGDVIFDNETSDLENHKDRQEIIDAFNNIARYDYVYDLLQLTEFPEALIMNRDVKSFKEYLCL